MNDIKRAVFINEIGPIIKKEGNRCGYKLISPIIAQALTESEKENGLSQLASKYHNYFGMKCGKSWTGKAVNLKTNEEYTPGKITQIKDYFRVYEDMLSGVKGYFDFISVSRYKNLKTARTPKEYLETLKSAGYATSNAYVDTCMNKIRKNNLTRFDDIVTPFEPYREPICNVKKGMRGDIVKWVQHNLCLKGYVIKVDGIFGEITDSAIRKFQFENGLLTDGIVGPKTRKALKGG